MPTLPLVSQRNNTVRAIDLPSSLCTHRSREELLQTSFANSWEEIERIARTVDEERVKDCIEDTDTLLVLVRVSSVYPEWL